MPTEADAESVPRAATIRQLREALLPETIEWCRKRSTFYCERFAGVPKVTGLEDLPLLPVLMRRDIVANHAALRCDPSLPAAVQHTTGTTGPFLQLHRSAAEQAFLWGFFATQAQALPQPRLQPLHVNLVNAYHGTPISVPTSAYVLSVGVFDRAQAVQARGVIEREYDLPGVEPRVSALSGTERMVMALTAYLVAEGFDFARCTVRKIALFGGHVPPARKHLLARLWNAEISDYYSMTEMFGGARECGAGGAWVFDANVIPEVVHPETLRPVKEGVGVLLLTGLYPFVQQMPLVRYFTEDLVGVVGDDGALGLRVNYVGRLRRSVLDLSGPDVRPLLLSGPLYEMLLELPDIAISPRFPDLAPGNPGLELTGDLHYAVAHRPATADRPEEIVVRLGLRYAPWMYVTRVAEVVDKLVAALFERFPALATRCADGSLVLRVLPETADSVPPHDSK